MAVQIVFQIRAFLNGISLEGKNLFPALGQAQVIDHDTLTILGKVIASWRAS